MANLIHGELSESIIGAGMAVLNELKPGLDEKLYENALVIELAGRGHSVEQHRTFNVHYIRTAYWAVDSRPDCR